MRHLNAITLFLLFAVPSLAIAWGYGGAYGKNALGQRVSIIEDDLLLVQGPNEEDDSIRYITSKECPEIIEWLDMKPKKGLLIHCPSTGKSPLAGATYTKIISKRIKNVCDYHATIFKCVAGCDRKVVPQILVEEPWEC